MPFICKDDRVFLFSTNLVGASLIEDRLEVLEIDVTQFVQPEVVDGGCRHRKVVLLKTNLKKVKL
jgi:hypothetical protein